MQWPNGTVINWVGEYKPKEYKSIYANRNTLFKGHKRERERQERKKEIADRVNSMEKRIAEWKAVSVLRWTAFVTVQFRLPWSCLSCVVGQCRPPDCVLFFWPDSWRSRSATEEETRAWHGEEKARRLQGRRDTSLTIPGGRRGEVQPEAVASVLNITALSLCIMHYSSENAHFGKTNATVQGY